MCPPARSTGPVTSPGPLAFTAGRWLHLLRAGLVGLAFVGFFVGAGLLGALVLPLVHLGPGSLAVRQRRCQRLVRASWRVLVGYLRWMGLLALDRGGPRMLSLSSSLAAPCALPEQAIVIANHPTLLDIIALTVAVGPGSVVAKPSLFRSPVLGPLLRACGHLATGLADQGPLSTVDRAEACLRAGHNVILFPEGTRSPVGGIGVFRLGAFELARRSGVPLVPVRISATPPVLWKGARWFELPRTTVRLRLEVMAPVRVPSTASPQALRALMDEMRVRLVAPQVEPFRLDEPARAARA